LLVFPSLAAIVIRQSFGSSGATGEGRMNYCLTNVSITVPCGYGYVHGPCVVKGVADGARTWTLCSIVGDSSTQVPVADQRLSEAIPSHGDHGTVGPDSHSVGVACGDLDDVRPAVDVALPGPVRAHRNQRAI